MARSFRSPGIFIPFRDGLIVEDRGSWVLEEISNWGILQDGSRVSPPWMRRSSNLAPWGQVHGPANTSAGKSAKPSLRFHEATRSGRPNDS